MALEFSTLGALISDAFTYQLFGNQIITGIVLLILAIVVMLGFRMTGEAIVGILSGFIIVLVDQGNFVDPVIKYILYIVVAALFGIGIYRFMTGD